MQQCEATRSAAESTPRAITDLENIFGEIEGPTEKNMEKKLDTCQRPERIEERVKTLWTERRAGGVWEKMRL